MVSQEVVIVGGGGHVGLPLGIVFADCGLRVKLLEIDAKKVAAINSGCMPFMEAGAEKVLRRVVGSSLTATLDHACLRNARTVVAVVGTPVDRHLNPTVVELHRSIDAMLDKIADDALLVLRSTVYPGASKLVYDRIQRRGGKVHLAFCPERIAEGRAMEELSSLPQIVAAFTPEARSRAHELFLRITPHIIDLEPLEAELAKLFTNSWRYLNFAISNQFYVLAESYGLDFHRIHEAVTRDYPRMRSFARAGFAAGPCLLKDTLQLSAFSGNSFFMGHAAMLINEGLPNFIVNQLRARDLPNRHIAILGMAFKADSDDYRESLSYKLRHLLEVEANEVLCSDPFVQDATLVPLEIALSCADTVILGAPHTVYRDLVIPPDKHVIDIWGFWRDTRSKPLPVHEMLASRA